MTGPSHSAAPLPPPVHLQRRLRQETPPANIARKSKRFLSSLWFRVLHCQPAQVMRPVEMSLQALLIPLLARGAADPAGALRQEAIGVGRRRWHRRSFHVLADHSLLAVGGDVVLVMVVEGVELPAARVHGALEDFDFSL